MEKNNINKNKLVVPIFLGILGVVLIISFLINFYNRKIDDFNTQIFQDVGGGTFSVFSGYENVDSTDTGGEPKPDNFTVGIKPGGQFKGILGIRNYEDIEHVFAIGYDKFVEISDNPDDQSARIEGITVSLTGIKNETFKLEPEGVKFVEYTIQATNDVPEGEYKSILRSKAVDENAQKMTKGGVTFDLAVGTAVRVVVAENPPIYEYEDLSLQAKTLAYNYVLSRCLYAITGIFVLVTLYLVFFAFKKSFNHKSL